MTDPRPEIRRSFNANGIFSSRSTGFPPLPPKIISKDSEKQKTEAQPPLQINTRTRFLQYLASFLHFCSALIVLIFILTRGDVIYETYYTETRWDECANSSAYSTVLYGQDVNLAKLRFALREEWSKTKDDFHDFWTSKAGIISSQHSLYASQCHSFHYPQRFVEFGDKLMSLTTFLAKSDHAYISLGLTIFFFFILSSVFEFLFFDRTRYLEYSLSASIMIIILSLQVNVFKLFFTNQKSQRNICVTGWAISICDASLSICTYFLLHDLRLGC